MSNQIASPVVNASGKTRLRESLERAKRGEGPSVGQWLEFPGYTLARTIAPLGQDWVLIDCEHGNIDDHDMYLQVGAIGSSGTSPIVRIPSDQPWMMKRVLDAGAHAIMVPMCETKEQAEAIVRACKYPSSKWSQGVRGAGAMFASANFNQNGREYLLSANDNVMICVQIETRKALENVEEIASVDGIDMLFIGPNDLASSMGYIAFDHPNIQEVQDATERILKAALDAGKYAGHFALSADIAAKRYKQGFHFVNCGADIVAVTAWMSSEMAKLQNLLQEAIPEPVAAESVETKKQEYN
ncbi:2-dehydro-3-deoxyglucarate aldolase [Xylariales sp. PMI_506]|nr:2-dehydro-3-deoxyglucarate aldolase [Xylariales sp. PMI_506]